jgi:hypothetical protein
MSHGRAANSVFPSDKCGVSFSMLDAGPSQHPAIAADIWIFSIYRVGIWDVYRAGLISEQ